MTNTESPLKALVTGSHGQIGWELCRALRDEATVFAPSRADMNFECPKSVADGVARYRPDVIINAAGYTAVDRAESEPDLALRINGESVAALARAARDCGAALLHISTDYVFDGCKTTPYHPGDIPNPRSAYGRSKLAGEIAVRESGAAAIVLRTSWVYSMRGRNFVLAIMRQAASRRELRVVNDQIGSPTWARSVARAVAAIALDHVAGETGHRHFSGKEGVYHATCQGQTSWFDFARAVFQEAGSAQPLIVPVSTADYSAKAARPAYSVLDCSRTTEVFGITLSPWRQALHEAIKNPEGLSALAAVMASPASNAR